MWKSRPSIDFHYSCSAQPLESGQGRSPYTLYTHPFTGPLLTQKCHRARSREAGGGRGTPGLPVVSAACSPSSVADLHRCEAASRDKEERILQRFMWKLACYITVWIYALLETWRGGACNPMIDRKWEIGQPSASRGWKWPLRRYKCFTTTLSNLQNESLWN